MLLLEYGPVKLVAEGDGRSDHRDDHQDRHHDPEALNVLFSALVE